MPDLFAPTPAQDAISVSQLNRRAKQLLEQGIARLWIEGEISNLARPASGHLYFSLKDDAAQVRVAFFRQRQRGPTIRLADGDQVLVFGRVSLFEQRGEFQVIAEQVEPAGEGVLKREFDKLKRKLQAEGLFDAALKQPLPAVPACIGVITSPTGAAVRDVISVLRRRFPAVPVIVYPAAVQGDSAPAELRAALETAVRRHECDVLIVGRGGGSIEDLWAFNDETLARAIHACPIPIVSAVGHEVDVTIADFVADVRAPTPSGAAELVVPDQAAWQRQLDSLANRLARLGQRAVDEQAQLNDWLAERLGRALADRLRTHTASVQELQGALLRLSPAAAVQRSIGRLRNLHHRLAAAGRYAAGRPSQRLALAARALQSVSPLATLERGYAVVRDTTGRVLLRARDVSPGDSISALLNDGTLSATVTATGDAADDA